MNRFTAQRMQELVVAADRETLCKEMEPLSEAQRQSLAADAVKLAAKVDAYCSPFTEKEVPSEAKQLADKVRKAKYPDWRSPRWTSQLLLVGLCDCDVIKFPLKYGVDWLRTDLKDMQQRMLQILEARRPKWLADWLAWEWKQETPVASWYLERGLIRCGALPPNDSPAYYARMAMEDRVLQSEYVDTYDTLPLFKNRREMLEADPGLFQHDIWRLLETDTFAFRYAHFGWPDLMVELCQAGKLDRAKLLARCVHGMSLPLSVTTLGGLVKFHDQLSPSNAERQVLLQDYLCLLHQNHAGVVGLAISSLEKLHRIQQLPLEEFTQHLPAVFALEKKGAVKSALKLMDAMAWHFSADPGLRKVLHAVMGGLQHADADIQRATLELMHWRRELIDDELSQAIAAHSETVAAAVKPELKKLLAKAVGNSPALATSADDNSSKVKASPVKSKSKKTSASPAQQSISTVSLSSAISSGEFGDIPELIRQQAHLNAALQASQQNVPPVVLPVAPHHPPRRDPARAVHPIADVDELIDTVASVMQRVDDVMQLERCLDGIMRLRFSPPADFEQRSAALHKVVSKRLEIVPVGFDLLANIGFLSMVARWLKLKDPKHRLRGKWYEMRYWFLRARCSEANRLIEDGTSVPMLALPTHTDGWIDPEVLVARINDSYAKHRILLGDCDLAQAMLRLTPDGRSHALKKLGSPDHYNGNIELRYALGDDVEPVFNQRNSMIQVAAVRARMISLAEQNYQPALPIAQARLDDQQRIIVSGALIEDPTVPFGLWEKALSYSPVCTDVVDPKHHYAWLDRWEALTNPMDHAADCLAGRTSHLMDPESTWTAAACRLAILAASHDRSEVRIETTDAIIEAAARLLIVPSVFGQALAENLPHIKLNRVAKVLADACSSGPLHHWVILESLAACIVNLSTLPTDIHLLLAQMLDSAATLEIGIDEAARKKLETLDAKSKSGKLAKQLQKITTGPQALAAIHTAIIGATADRARRWRFGVR